MKEFDQKKNNERKKKMVGIGKFLSIFSFLREKDKMDLV